MTADLYCPICGLSFQPTDELKYFEHKKCDEYTECDGALCEECFRSWKSVLSSNGWKNIKCQICDTTINSNSFIDYLNDEEKEDYFLNQISGIEISSDEKWLTCSECGYREIGDLDDTFLLCKNQSCGKLTCLICHDSINYSPDHIVPFKTLSSNQTALRSMIENIDQEMIKHSKCNQYADLIFQIERALEDSTSRKCPSCNHRGRKDENCTHITCELCGNYWCYICLQSIDDDHNRERSDFSDFCPMYMYNISEFRSSWPCDSEDALAKFHHHLGLYRLNCIYSSLDTYIRDIYFDEIDGYFPHVLSGFELDDIKNFSGYIFRAEEN